MFVAKSAKIPQIEIVTTFLQLFRAVVVVCTFRGLEGAPIAGGSNEKAK